MKYNKANIHEVAWVAIHAARKDDKPRYVFATAFGYRITATPPDGIRQDFYMFGPTQWQLARLNLKIGLHVWTEPKFYSQPI